MNLIEIILNNLMELMPFIIVRAYMRGVRWPRFGAGDPVELKPGLRRKLWFWDQVEVAEILDEAVELPMQSVVTKDHKSVAFSCNIAYRINDVIAYWSSVQDFQESVRSVAMTHLAQRVRAQEFSDIDSDLSKLESSLRGTLTTRLKSWGVEVFSVGFTNFAEQPMQVRILSDVPLPALHHSAQSTGSK